MVGGARPLWPGWWCWRRRRRRAVRGVRGWRRCRAACVPCARGLSAACACRWRVCGCSRGVGSASRAWARRLGAVRAGVRGEGSPLSVPARMLRHCGGLALVARVGVRLRRRQAEPRRPRAACRALRGGAPGVGGGSCRQPAAGARCRRLDDEWRRGACGMARGGHGGLRGAAVLPSPRGGAGVRAARSAARGALCLRVGCGARVLWARAVLLGAGVRPAGCVGWAWGRPGCGVTARAWRAVR